MYGDSAASRKRVAQLRDQSGDIRAAADRLVAQAESALSLEDRGDPVALLGSLINADVTNRVTVVYDGADAGAEPYIVGGRAADEAQHPGLRAEIRRITELGYLAG